MLSDIVATPPPTTTRVGERLLATAAGLFYERGITAVGVDLIADEAGSTKRTLYQRFGSKDGLILAYLQLRAHQWQTRVLAALAQADAADAAEGIEVVFGTAAQWAVEARRGCAFVNAWAELGPAHGQASAVIQAEKEWMLRLFTAVVGDRERATDVYLIYEGAQMAASVLDDPSLWERAARTAAGLVRRPRAPSR